MVWLKEDDGDKCLMCEDMGISSVINYEDCFHCGYRGKIYRKRNGSVTVNCKYKEEED